MSGVRNVFKSGEIPKKYGMIEASLGHHNAMRWFWTMHTRGEGW
jgi:hypothetical protein